MSWKEKLVTGFNRAIPWLLASMPLLVCVIFQGGMLLAFRYPAFDPSMLGTYLVLMLISLAPFLVWVLCWFAWFRRGERGFLRWCLSVVCAVWTGMALFAQALISFACPIYSETANPAHYLKLNDWSTGQNSMICELFPEKPGAASQREMQYYYRDAYCVDPIYELYAEWTLPADELVAEKQRVEALFAAQPDHWTVETIEYGAFTCLLCYVNDRPFAGEVDYYSHAIFAYDEDTGRVRYICNDGTDANGYDEEFQPKYLSLDW